MREKLRKRVAVMHPICWLPTVVANQKGEGKIFFLTEWYILSAEGFPICAAEHGSSLRTVLP